MGNELAKVDFSSQKASRQAQKEELCLVFQGYG